MLLRDVSITIPGFYQVYPEQCFPRATTSMVYQVTVKYPTERYPAKVCTDGIA